jgi:excinuclease UvrABC nuclease subunit
LVLELDSSLPFDAANDAEFFSQLPGGLAVCLVEMQNPQAEPLLIRTQNLRRRVQRLLGPADPTSKRLNLREIARGVRFRAVGSTFEQTVTHYQNAKQLFPQRYRDLLRLRPPAVLKVSLRNAYPRCYVTRYIPTDGSGGPSGGTYYGPFPSRGAALAFANRALDFFKMRRCQIKIRRDPTFPGCLYSEMRMCLAPCFAGCSKEEYDAEVGRFVKFLESSGESLRAAFETEREKASDDLDFERAAAVHKKVEKLDDVLRGRPDVAQRIQSLDALILQRGAGEQVVAAFGVRGGRLMEPFFLPFQEMASQPRSAEQLFRNYLEPGSTSEVIEEKPLVKGELAENLWLLARWFYSNPRAGEIFFREKNEWPYRRILRACARVLAPPAADAPPNNAPSPEAPTH